MNRQAPVIVFAGTSHGRRCIEALLAEGIPVIASSFSDYGDKQLKDHPLLERLVGAKTPEDIVKMIDDKGPRALIDATHPYARQISENIVKALQIRPTPCLAYERASSIGPDVGIHKNSLEEVLQYLQALEGNVFFTTGISSLKPATDILSPQRIVLRMIPSSVSYKKLHEVTARIPVIEKQVIVAKPPFEEEDNRKIIRQYNIRYLVTKDSGKEGNTDQKINVAIQEGLSIIVIDRPQIHGRDQVNISVTEDVNDVLFWVKKQKKS